VTNAAGGGQRERETGRPTRRSPAARPHGFALPGQFSELAPSGLRFARAGGSAGVFGIRWALRLRRRTSWHASAPGAIALAAPGGASRAARAGFAFSSLRRTRHPRLPAVPVCGDALGNGSTRLSVAVGGKGSAGFDLAGGRQPAGQQVPVGGGAAAPGFSGMESGAAASGAPFQHPACQQGERGFFHHFIQQHHEFAAKIGRMLQLAHFKIAQGSTRTLAEVLHRRPSRPCHMSSPGARWLVDGPVLRGTVADFHIYTQPFLPVVNPGAGCRNPGSRIARCLAFPGGPAGRGSMCSGCSGDPEEPPESLPARAAAQDDPFWAWWKQPPDDEEDADAGAEAAGSVEPTASGSAPADTHAGEVA